MKSSPVALAALLILGCAELPTTPLTREATIGGAPVFNTAIRLNKAFRIRPGIGLYSETFPEGLYVAKFEDEEGVYFEATVPVLDRSPCSYCDGSKSGRNTIGYGNYPREGLYVSKQSWSRYRAYIDRMPGLDKYDTPIPIDFTVIKLD
jgi:hypothetical protein